MDFCTSDVQEAIETAVRDADRTAPTTETTSWYSMPSWSSPRPAATTGGKRAATCAAPPTSTSGRACWRGASRIGPVSARWSPNAGSVPPAWSRGSSNGCGAGSSNYSVRFGRATRSSRTRSRQSRPPRRRRPRWPTTARCRPRASTPGIARAHRRTPTGGRDAGAGGARAGGAAISNETCRRGATTKTRGMPGDAIRRTPKATNHAGGAAAGETSGSTGSRTGPRS